MLNCLTDYHNLISSDSNAGFKNTIFRGNYIQKNTIFRGNYIIDF
nr:MAG TPA: hypothetical protein [Caudoviricetes sp.]